MLVHYPKGNYSFLRGIAPYSAGVRADSGFEIVHVRFQSPVPLAAGFTHVQEHLKASSRPAQALCGMELRSPAPFTFEGFNAFNATYVHVLKEWGIVVDGVNPVARTNVAPAIDAPSQPALYGFSYTSPSDSGRGTFVVAGAGELPEGSLKPDDVVRRGDTSPQGMKEKVGFVAGLMAGRLKGLGVAPEAATTVNMYTVHSVCGIVAHDIVGRARHGVTWHYSRPPILSIEYEMDMRGTARELMFS